MCVTLLATTEGSSIEPLSLGATQFDFVCLIQKNFSQKDHSLNKGIQKGSAQNKLTPADPHDHTFEPRIVKFFKQGPQYTCPQKLSNNVCSFK